jgi:hypothetical protein
MDIAVGALIGLVVACLIAIWRMLRRNKDPKQQQLALMFMTAAVSESRADAAGEIGEFINNEGWDRVKATPRIAHALSLVKVTQPALYERAVEVSRCDELWAKIHGALNPPPQSN